MTKIKLCGLTCEADIEAANRLKPEYVGFVFAGKSKRFVTKERAKELKEMLDPGIVAVGVFVNEKPETIADYLESDIIDIAQLHGDEDNNYIKELRRLTDKKIIKACKITRKGDLKIAEVSSADHILLDAGAGEGKTFDWSLLKGIQRRFFLAGGLSAQNVAGAIDTLHPYAVDVSSGIETDGKKDPDKMQEFVNIVRK